MKRAELGAGADRHTVACNAAQVDLAARFSPAAAV